MGDKWQGGDMLHPGGAHKIVLLKEFLSDYKDDMTTIILFTDGFVRR